MKIRLMYYYLGDIFLLLKGGYAHSYMHIFDFELIDLDLWNACCEVSSWGSFLFTLQRQKKVCTPGDEAVMKIHKKLFSGIPINFTLFVISPKLQRIWSWNFGFAIRKIWPFIWYQKIYYFRLSPGDENVIGIRAFNNSIARREANNTFRYRIHMPYNELLLIFLQFVTSCYVIMNISIAWII